MAGHPSPRVSLDTPRDPATPFEPRDPRARGRAPGAAASRRSAAHQEPASGRPLFAPSSQSSAYASRSACFTFTFAGSAFPITYPGAAPVFVDSEPRSWNMDPALLEQALGDRIRRGTRPKAVIVVHLYGQPADMDAITGIGARHEVPLIEDAAESLGATHKGRHTGTIGRFGILSFNGNKIITTGGGGMLLGHSAEEIARVRARATQAREPAPHYEHTRIGHNYRLSNIAAAIGRH